MPFPIIPIIGAVTSAISALTSRASSSADRLGKDDFLKLLVAQLKNQNPLNPLSNDQFVTQSAQFSSLEELQNIRKSLDTVAGTSGSSSLGATTALLGRTVSATAATFTYAGAPAVLPFALPAAVSNAVLEISDAKGTIISQTSLGARAAGEQSATFQPALSGQALPAGQYRYRILSLDSGSATPLAVITGTVTGVNLESGTPQVLLGTRRVLVSDITAVRTTTN
jgi:flagellar basal-body rod modification protein FlgD